MAQGTGTQPIVAIHDSELTRALEVMPLTNGPTGLGTTNKQWWTTDWHYFVMPESVKEALRSDGTAFTVVGDSDIMAGGLLTNGAPRYPILISLASEAIHDNEISALTNYVAKGGFLVVGSSAFTRTTDGTSRGDFAFASALGLHMVRPGLTNWAGNNTLTTTNQTNHILISHIPGGELTNRIPSSSEEISWGISPSHPFLAAHDIWQVQATGATVLAVGDDYPLLCVKAYGKGYFIYHAAFQPLIGHGGFAPSMYAYVIFRRAIEWAFQSANLPIPKLSPWPYPYDAAFMVRHDLENYTDAIRKIETSALTEFTNGARGDYYFCTGTVREDVSNTTRSNIIAGLRRAVTNYGATIGPHNGGLKNPNDTTLVRGQFQYWHWGPDEALDVTPAGYPSGKTYALTSISNSFTDVEGWMSGTGNGNGFRPWVSCYFNATREDSYDIQERLGVKINGEQKLTPFPHWTLSTQTPGKRYSHLSQPVSDWYVGGLIAQSLEPWHWPGIHTSETMHEAIDFYYNLGALINIYSHTLTLTNGGGGSAGTLVFDYVTYGLNTNLHPRLWSANAVDVYQWWLQRSKAQTSVSFTTNGNQSVITVSIASATDTNTAIEILVPTTHWFCGLSVMANGLPAPTDSYRINDQVIKLCVGTTVTNVVIGYYPLAPGTQVFSESFDGVNEPALPAGWTTSSSGALSAWETQSRNHDTGPNAAFAADAADIGISELVSPPIPVPVGTAQLTFRNNYDLDRGTNYGNDGGVLEIKIGTNGFTDILTAGGSFVSAGYNCILGSDRGNPLGGQVAWSGDSAGYIPTVVNLPVAAGGQIIQLKWRCATDDADTRSGWRIDTVTITNRACSCCGGGSANTPPVLPPQDNLTLAELTTLVVGNTAADGDVPAQTLSYELIAPPAGVSISTGGLISWTPNETQGPGTYILNTVVTDDGVPPSSASNSFTVTVAEVNGTPILPLQSNRTVLKLTALVVTNTATDADLPVNALTYSLVNPPDGAAINADGIIEWTPTAAQGPATNLITTVVTDSGDPPLNATNSFLVFVSDSNVVSRQLFADDFTRSAEPDPLAPWVAQSGEWSVNGGELRGGKNAAQTYAHAYLTNNWTNYSVQARFSFPAGADGGGVGGYLDPTTGAHYGAWIYPEDSPGGPRLLRLLKFQDWTTWRYNGSDSVPMNQATLPSVGTSWHTLTLSLSNSQITVSYDTNQLISVTDTEAAPYTGGGVCVSMWTASTKYFMSVDDLVVTSLANGQSFISNSIPPRVESIDLAEGALVIRWTAVSGQTYRLQSTENLENAAWNDVPPNVVATGSVATVTNAIGSSSQRFYRVVLMQ